MKKLTGKRVIAYLIDVIIVYLIVSLFTGIDGINPSSKQYEEAYTEYTEIYSQYTEAVANNASGLEEVQEQMLELSYKISKYGSAVTLINLFITAVYFILFMFFNKGQTLGMKLLKMKVVSGNNNNLSFVQILFRSLLIYSVLTGALSYLLLEFASKETYLRYGVNIQLFDMAFVALSLITMMFRKDGKGAHDIITNTLVISTKEEKNEIKEAKFTESEDKSKETKSKKKVK